MNWISVSEKLPEFSGLYLISVDELVTVANFTGSYFMNRGGDKIKVDAWQPLPEPYNGDGARLKHKSIPYTYNAPEHDWKCGYSDIIRDKGGAE